VLGASRKVDDGKGQTKIGQQDGANRHPSITDRLCHERDPLGVRKGGSANRWLAALVARKLKKLAAVAMANKMVRMIWAPSTKQESYKMP
jgi:hypothetical protein